MENGVAVVEGSHTEGKLMENEGLDSVVEETSLVESHGSEEDEVFEEAVAVQDIPVANGDDTVDSAELSGDHAGGDEKTGPGNDLEKFEETIGVPLSVDIEEDKLPVHVDNTVETLVHTELVNHSELHGAVDESDNLTKSELGETENIVPISSHEQVGGDISDANSTAEVGSLEDGNQNDQKSEIVVQTGENGVQEPANLPEVVVQENSDVGTTTEDAVEAVEEPEAGDSVIVSGGDSDSALTKSPGENLHRDENGEEGKESLGLPDTDHKDSEILVKEEPVVSDSHTDMEEVKDQSVIIDKLPEDNQSKVPKEEISSSPVHLDGNEWKEDLKDIVNSGLKDQVDRELDHASVTTDSNHLVTNVESENKTHPAAEEPEVTLEVDKLPASEDPGVVKIDEKTENKTHQTMEEPEVTPEVDTLPASEESGVVKIDEETENKTRPTAVEPEVTTEVDIFPTPEDSGVVMIDEKTENKSHPIAEEAEVTLEVDKLPTSEDSGVVKIDEKTEKLPISEDSTVVEIVEEVFDLPTPRDSTLVETDKNTGTTDLDVAVRSKLEGSKHEFVDKDVEASTVEVKEPETKGVIHEEVRPSVQENREPENKPAAVSLPSRKPADQTPTPARPAGLGSAAPLLEPSRVVQQPRVNGSSSHMQTQLVEEPSNGEAEENDETREKLQMIRVKFLRLAHRLGQTPHNVVVAQVLYRLGLAEQLRGRNGGRVGAFSFDRASAMAEQLEAAGQEPLDFSCTIMVLGKSGVGKSATINSIFDEAKFGTDAFQLGTKKVQDVVGTVQGIKVRVIDTPGLLPSWSDQRQNEKILHSVKRFIKKTPPDIVLYLDRLDMQSRDFGDMPLLRTITDIFGPSIWFNAIVVLTHAASAPPEGPNGTATSYDMFVTQRSHVVQQAIRQAAGDMRLMNPVSLVENHSACRTNRAGQRVLPNGQVWKPHLLLLSFASKILAEANTLLKLQDSPPGRPFATRTRAPPLPFLLSSLLQSRPQLKLPEEQLGDDDTLDDDLDDSSDSDDESAYDELPPFKRLSKAQLAKLTKAQKRAYYDELEYREKLFMKKQLKEEKKRRRFMKKMADSAKDLPSEYSENVEEESGGAASVPVPMPDLALPASFDSDNPTHRYRYLDSPNQWVVRPVLDTHGWDHDIGYEGVNVEKVFVVKQEIPVSFSGQVTKDKKDSNLQMEISSSLKHGKDKATSLGLEMQTLGKDMVYTLRSDTRFSNYRRNKATAGVSVTLLGDALTAGVKIEDKLIANKRFGMVVSGGAMAGRGDVAYGGSLEATLRDKDHPLGRSLTTLGLSVMDWHGDLAIGGNLQSQIPIGRSTNLIARANLNNRSSGQVSIRLNSSEQLQIALIALLPLLRKIYPQQLQFGQW